MNDLREKIARALIEDVYPELRDAWGSLTDAHKAGYLKRADAVLAVLDMDKERAEAQVEALREAADDWHAENAGTAPRMHSWLHDRADRIAREAGIETKGATDD